MDEIFVDGFEKALAGSEWQLIVGGVLMMLALISRKVLKDIIPQKEMDLFVCGISLIAFIGEALFSGRSITSALVSGFVVFGVAAGFWDLLGRRIKYWIPKQK